MKFNIDDDTKRENIDEVIDLFKQHYKKTITIDEVSNVLDCMHQCTTIGLIKGFHLYFKNNFKYTNYSITFVRQWYNDLKKQLIDYGKNNNEDVTEELEALRLKRNEIIKDNEQYIKDLRNKNRVTLQELKDAPIYKNYNKTVIKLPEEYINFKEKYMDYE